MPRRRIATNLFALLLLAFLGCQGVAPPPAPTAAGRGAVAAAAERVVRAADGLEIHYTARGAGTPALVFVHGWSCDRTYWGDLPGRYADRHRVLNVDLAGHGASGTDRAVWDSRRLAADVVRVLAAEAIDDAILVGHSMGGDVILEIADLAPGRVVALVGVDTYQQVENHFDPDELAALVERMGSDYRGVTESLLRQYFFQPTTDPELVERIVADMLRQPAEIAIPLFHQALAYDMAEGLSRVAVPVRAINSDLEATDREMARRHAPDFDAVVLEGVGHFVMLEAPRRFAMALDDVLCELASTSCRTALAPISTHRDRKEARP